MGFDAASWEAKAYWRRRYLLKFFDASLLPLFLTVVQFSGFSVKIRDLTASISINFYSALLLYLILLNLLFTVISFPLELYGGFLLEHKYNLSNMTLAMFIKDEVKKGVISFSITALLAEAAYAMARNLPAIWWQAASLFWIAFSVFFIKLFPVLIIPLFYAYKPLSSGELRKRILLLAERFNIKVMDVSEIDFSKKTKKANAAVTGWGGTKRIILADNLVKEFSPGEIEVVVAHEMAHHKLGHVWKLIGAGSVPVVLFFYVIGAFGETICGYCGIGHILDISNLPLAWLVLSVLCLISMPLQNAFSRMLESEADRLSVEKTGSLSAFISLMEHLARTNLADRNPGRLMEFLFYSHPPIDRRIEAARRYDGI